MTADRDAEAAALRQEILDTLHELATADIPRTAPARRAASRTGYFVAARTVAARTVAAAPQPARRAARWDSAHTIALALGRR